MELFVIDEVIGFLINNYIYYIKVHRKIDSC